MLLRGGQAVFSSRKAGDKNKNCLPNKYTKTYYSRPDGDLPPRPGGFYCFIAEK